MAKHYVSGDPKARHKVGFVAGALGERITIDRRHDRLEFRVGMLLSARKEIVRKFNVWSFQ